jgi:MerR family transcriptional regulator, light-induced transcriptional regulator
VTASRDLPVSSQFQPVSFGDTYRRYVDGLIAGDRHLSRQIFEECLESMRLPDLYRDLVQRSLYEIGQLWEQGQLSVGAEHLATAITESMLNLAYPYIFARPRTGKSAVVACLPNEHHQIGGKMVADCFELNGWRSYYLGANTPLCGLRSLIDDKRPDVVAISVTMASGRDLIVNAVGAIRGEFPGLPILFGGRALSDNSREELQSVTGVQCLCSLLELEAWIKEYERNA